MPVICPGDKQLRPISGRVGEIAEFALYYVMEKVVRIVIFIVVVIELKK